MCFHASNMLLARGEIATFLQKKAMVKCLNFAFKFYFKTYFMFNMLTTFCSTAYGHCPIKYREKQFQRST